ncbi:hypothetical protein I4U23_024017 [Adineta vaga]|nr:hypothetical protein I4U23_024017 [Adineta vaga]
MQSRILFVLFISISLTETKPKCPIKKYKLNTYITGDQLLLEAGFHDRIKPLENAAKNCKVRLVTRGSYYQLPEPEQQVPTNEADIVIGHGFHFQLRNEDNAIICNKKCLENNPTDNPEVDCFLRKVINHGLTWSSSNPDVISDGTYAANANGYQAMKIDIQTRCEKEKFKRQLLRALRKMYDEEDN